MKKRKHALNLPNSDSRLRNAKFLVRGRAPRFDALGDKNKKQRGRLNNIFAASRPGFKSSFAVPGKYAFGTNRVRPAKD